MRVGEEMDASELLSEEMRAGLTGDERYRLIIMKQGEERLVLPVTPYRYEVRTAQDNKLVKILDTGERLLFGNSNLKTLRFSSFFPAQKHYYPYVQNIEITPQEAVTLLEKWRTAKAPVRVIITQSPVNLQMAIQNFNYEERDGTRDIYYSVEMTEYKEFNTPSSNSDKAIDEKTGLRDRADDDKGASDYKKFNDPYEAAKDVYGDFDSLPNFLEDNDLDGVTPRDYGGLVMW